jgi:hypothetical protein
MPKIFYTERDIDELKARGVSALDITDNMVITDLALERAMRYDMKINRPDSRSAPKATLSGSVNLVAAYPRPGSAGDAELKQKIRSAVLAKLDGQVDAAVLDAVISRVVSSLK